MPLDQPDADAAGRKRRKPSLHPDDFRMPLGDHIEELRGRLIKALVGIGVAAVFTFYFGFQIIGWLVQPLVQAQHELGFPPQTYTFDPDAGFTGVYLKVSLIAALIFACPWVIWQLWQFVVSGLYEHERKAAYLLAPFSTIMTVLAVLFAYYILLPTCLAFFFSFATKYPEVEVGEPMFMLEVLGYSDGRPDPTPGAATRPALLPVLTADPPDPQEGAAWINAAEGQVKVFYADRPHVLNVAQNRLLSPLPSVTAFVSFAARMLLAITVAFQLPVVMLVMGWTGLFDPAIIARFRKFAVFGCVAAGAILTPQDLASMFILAVPLYGLFEFGLLLMRWADRMRGSGEDDDAFPDEL